MTRLLPLFTLPLLLAACTTTAPSTMPVPSITISSRPPGEALTLEQALARVADADIVLVGELHTHPAVHLLQARMLAGLAADGRPGALHGAVQPRRSAGAGCLPGRSHRRGGAHS